MTDTHYDVLSITADAPDDIVRAAYLALARKYHPDRNLTNSEAMRMMQLINIAHQALGHPDRRTAYNMTLGLKAGGKPATEAVESKTVFDEKTQGEINGWKNVLARTEKEARSLRERSNKAAAQREAAPAAERGKWEAWCAQAEAEAVEAEAKVTQAQKDLYDAQARATGSLPQANGAGSHYEALFLIPSAPIEVIRAVYVMLADKHGAEGKPAMVAAYKVLSDNDARDVYDGKMNFRRGESLQAAPVSEGGQVQNNRLKEAQEKTARAIALAEAAEAVAVRAREEYGAAQKAVQEAKAEAAAKAKDADAAKWADWAVKKDAEAQAFFKKSQKAAQDLITAKQAADDARRTLTAEEALASRLAATDAETAARNRAIREAAERAEKEHESRG